MLLRVGLLVLLAATAIWLSASAVVHRYLLPPVAQSPAPVAAPEPAAAAPEPTAPTAPAVRTSAVAVRRGDTLVRALQREGLDRRVSTDIAWALKRSGADLRKLDPEDPLELTWTLEGRPVALNWVPSPWLGYAVIANEGGWEVQRSERSPDVHVESVSGEVSRSLFEAVEAAGESAQLVLELVEIFSSDFDFTADTRSGDRFRLLVEKRYAGETFVDYGRILIAQYLSDGGLLTGVGFEPAGGGRYAFYDDRGRSLRKSFLKSPLEFTRITSGFTYARPHPILGGVRPHLAVDYAAPTGTPVRAVANGLVAAAGWSGGNGISITLRHRSGYQTMYNHLSRLAAGIRAGARVAQRQVIGFVGATGLATGPHLDYRVARNGSFVNPLGEKFIPGEPISPNERARFQQQAKTLIHQLEESAPF